MQRTSSRRRLGVVVVGVLLALVLWGGVFVDRYSGAPTAAEVCQARTVAASMPTAPLRVAEAYPRWLSQERGTVDDASCVDPVPVYGVAKPASEADVRRALAFARSHGLVVSVSGTRHSMGGQASFPGGLVLDMRGLDRVHVDEASSTVRVGVGATWRQVLEAVHARDLSVAAMPSIDVLSVGGTISVNAHGADFRTGSLASTVRSLRVMTADGTVRTLTREHEPELFHTVIGGYGLFGVILEAQLDLVPSEMYRLTQRTIPTADFPTTFDQVINPDQRNRLMFGHLSTSPTNFLEEVIVYTYETAETYDEPMPPLKAEQDSRVARFVLNLARHGGLGQRIKWSAQQHVLPRFRSCHEPRNEALRAAEACFASRNQAMYNDLGLLRHRLTQYTDVLQEYFLPHEQLVPFLAEARTHLEDHDAELLSASLRVVHDEAIMLDYARGERFSVVLYLSQRVDAAGKHDMAHLTSTLVGTALDHDGTFYLPYQQHYTRDELERAYPMVDDFFALKARHDPDLLFQNGFSSRYADWSRAGDGTPGA